ncbi:MAG: hypothetical protein ACOX9B_09630 [Candidatus Xenobium sp.]|jgi:hypothetical protein|nr:hypothetical protein [Burkholderiales bacterium]
MGKNEDVFRYRLPGKKLHLEEMRPILPPRLLQTLCRHGIQTVGALYEACRTGQGLDFLKPWQLKQIQLAFKVWPRHHTYLCQAQAKLEQQLGKQRYVPAWDWQDEAWDDCDEEDCYRYWKAAREILMAQPTHSLNRATTHAWRQSHCLPLKIRKADF